MAVEDRWQANKRRREEDEADFDRAEIDTTPT
jgi:hypothetical protein